VVGRFERHREIQKTSTVKQTRKMKRAGETLDAISKLGGVQTKRKRLPRAKMLNQACHLIATALSDHLAYCEKRQNDKVRVALSRAFELVDELREKHKP